MLSLIEAKKAEVDKYRYDDFINYNYTYLDDDFNITISSQLFDSLIVRNKLYKERIQSHKDSILVVLFGEFDNKTQINLAHNRITMSWLRVSYYIWLSESETKTLGARYSYKFPYELYDYIYNQQDQWDNYMNRFMEKLIKKVSEDTGNNEVHDMNYKRLLNFALKSNPSRIKDFEKVKNEGHSKH